MSERKKLFICTVVLQIRGSAERSQDDAIPSSMPEQSFQPNVSQPLVTVLPDTDAYQQQTSVLKDHRCNPPQLHNKSALERYLSVAICMLDQIRQLFVDRSLCCAQSQDARSGREFVSTSVTLSSHQRSASCRTLSGTTRDPASTY